MAVVAVGLWYFIQKGGLKGPTAPPSPPTPPAPTTGTLAGRVLTLAGTPLLGAKVRGAGKESNATDSAGNYRITDIPAGTYIFTATHGTMIVPTAISLVIPAGGAVVQVFAIKQKVVA